VKTDKGEYEKVEPKDIDQLMDQGLVVPIEASTLDKVFERTAISGMPNVDVSDYLQGVAIVLDNMSPPQTAKQLSERISDTRGSSIPEIHEIPTRGFKVIPLTAADGKHTDDPNVPLTRAVMVSKDDNFPFAEGNEWRERVAGTEWQVVQTALAREELFKSVTSFDAVVAGQAKMAALIAIGLSLILIVAYVWVRFGGIRYGIGAILSLMHDAVVAVAATVLSGVLYTYVFHKHPFLLISDFKINLTMIAAYLTVIGYSVNDTIVIFDRVRELRGKSNAPLSAKLVNDAINQCFGRTIWTTFTVFIVVMIMYIWGGEAIRGFSFAMLCGVVTGAYSTLAIASPMLLATASAADKAPTDKPKLERRNPFLAKNSVE
jgi:SecD/SecF fusion protein